MRLKGKVALITGAGGGIGRAAAILFAREGARVAVNDLCEDAARETVELVRQAGGDAIPVQADVSIAGAVRSIVQQATARYSKLDVLYNNAAIGYSTPITHGTVATIEDRDWDTVVRANLKSVYLCCKYAIPEMIRAGGGSIINTSSVMALRGMPSADAYTAAKGGIIALTRSLAVGLGPKNIRVNVICPGPIETPMIAEVIAVPEQRRSMENVPLGRLGQPEEVAYAALYLASDESSFVTGAVMCVDGGAAVM
jgi:NAD(P)-dependent dehydrogenase (short-subunit alcohol dehydrogenase family)